MVCPRCLDLQMRRYRFPSKMPISGINQPRIPRAMSDTTSTLSYHVQNSCKRMWEKSPALHFTCHMYPALHDRITDQHRYPESTGLAHLRSRPSNVTGFPWCDAPPPARRSRSLVLTHFGVLSSLVTAGGGEEYRCRTWKMEMLVCIVNRSSIIV